MVDKRFKSFPPGRPGCIPFFVPLLASPVVRKCEWGFKIPLEMETRWPLVFKRRLALTVGNSKVLTLKNGYVNTVWSGSTASCCSSEVLGHSTEKKTIKLSAIVLLLTGD